MNINYVTIILTEFTLYYFLFAFYRLVEQRRIITKIRGAGRSRNRGDTDRRGELVYLRRKFNVLFLGEARSLSVTSRRLDYSFLPFAVRSVSQASYSGCTVARQKSRGCRKTIITAILSADDAMATAAMN